MSIRWTSGFLAAVVLGAGVAQSSLAAGGRVILRSDNGPGGYYFALSGSGEDRFINQYLARDFVSESIICGARIVELNQGNPPFGVLNVDIRLEDPGNPGYPDVVGGLVATADAESLGTCREYRHRTVTFGGGRGVPSPGVDHFVSAIEPVHGTGGLDFCGVFLDTSSAYQGFAKYYSGGVFGAVPWNVMVEEIVFQVNHMDLNIRASGSARHPGDRGIPVVFTRRPNSGSDVTDDNITLSIAIDNSTGSLAFRNVEICGDQSVLDPKKGLRPITGAFRVIGGEAGIMNPIGVPVGRTVLRLEVARAGVRAYAASRIDKRVINLPLQVFVDDPSVDVDPCHLEGLPYVSHVDRDFRQLGLRRRAGSADDNGIESFYVTRTPIQPGDAINVRMPAIDMPRVAYAITGLEVVGGEFGGSGLPGLDAIELRTEDPVFAASPDFSAIGLLRSFGTADGIGEAPLGPVPTTTRFDVTDLRIDPPATPSLAANFFVVGLFLQGETTVLSAIGVDNSPGDTLLNESSFTFGALLPTVPLDGNAALRLLLDGDRSTLGVGGGLTATMSPDATLRRWGEFIAIDRWGRRIE